MRENEETNIRFIYFYRNAKGHSHYGAVVFANPERMSGTEADASIRAVLREGKWFDAGKAGIPLLYFSEQHEQDPRWHELGAVETTVQRPTDKRSFDMFIEVLRECISDEDDTRAEPNE